jgi:uncharacterized protein (DUF58 family)
MTPRIYKYLPPELAERLRRLGLTVRRPVEGAMQGLHRSPRHGASVEFADYREYAPGDPPGSIDWAVYARSDRYMIRRYQEETNLRGYILLDMSESMLFKEQGIHSKKDYAAFLAASLLYILVSQSDSAGLILFNDTIQKSFPAVGTVEALRPLLLALEEAESTGRSGIEKTLHAVAEQVRSRSLIILISDLLQHPGEILRGLRHLQHNGHQVVLLHVLDGAELRLTLTGRVDLRELETGARLTVDADELREAYEQEVKLYLDELRRGCADCSATYRLIETRQPLEEALQFRGLPV